MRPDKKIENMTVGQIKELKRLIRDDFANMLNAFFEKHPEVVYVRVGHACSKTEIDGYVSVYDVGLNGDSTSIEHEFKCIKNALA